MVSKSLGMSGVYSMGWLGNPAQLSASVHPEEQHMRTEVLGSLLPMAETRVEFWFWTLTWSYLGYCRD